MIKRTLQQAASMTAGLLAGTKEGTTLFQGVSTDTRTLKPGQLYIPLIGETFDGHAYVLEALEKGAAAALWQKDRQLPEGDHPLILVEDTLAALQSLAKSYRSELPVQVVAITGSNGKTSTKDMTASILSVSLRVRKTEGNLNNHIGLPLTLLRLEEDTQAAVVEMGMSGRGEIDLLTRIAAPDIVIITNIGESHLLQLGSREEIARAKTESLAGLKEGGAFIFNGDEPLIPKVLPEMPQPAHFDRIRFGTHPNNDIYPTSIEMEGEGTRFRIQDPDSPEFYLPLLGRHNVINALAAISAARRLGVSNEDIAEGLKSLKMTSMRIEALRADSGALVLNDAYNASPTSMKAALALLEELEGPSRKIVVLGDMLELGEREEEFHREIGRLLRPERIDRVYVYGRLSRHLAEEAQNRYPAGAVSWYEDKGELAKDLRSAVKPDDAVLVKGSRGMKLEEIVHALLPS
ncbi:UDP-N-acetylmuramoyl-tripeptide--D-alanyl-D-alanine ligase [Paenibacillus aurantius]|uniref:UDP-N-acetylmuramoyl-tripeptide--D-alanyl-D-alanine ligase n=1 Tax=Paenibacillus aurantius TaxID=2918900 RepID=A0AA96LHW5_9BACL|nr:UDP-N-acetylmuramoyl-tripeptide--D-alanyl-D-alanine ligase [Paenibacillus aurantius]WNQ13515.1 UDP-N-acetylmuramoyl-tripeptide--D-alanyl-D-alanine ligase [Paenibacillus aurantius]